MGLMGLDIGSTGAKAVVFSREGAPLSQAYREYPEVYPGPNMIELEPERVWQAIRAVISEAAAAAPEPVAALCISAPGECFTPVARDGSFLHNTIISMDSRSVAEVRELAEEVGAWEIFRITGMPVHPSFTLSKIVWLQKHRPEVHAATWKYLQWPEIVHLRLGLTPRIDYSLAGRTMAFDVVRKEWSERMPAAAGITADRFADPIASGETIGELSATAAAEVGLPPGALVVAGGHDQPMNALGAGVVRPGLAVDGMGTVGCITVAFAEPVLNRAMFDQNYCVYPHVKAGMYVTLAFTYSSGSILRWFRDQFGQLEQQQAAAEGRDVYEVILSDLPEGPTGLFLLPYFAGTGTPYMDPLAKGALLGLTLGCDRKSLVKALLEGICYELALNVSCLRDAGVEVQRLRATGGGSKSPTWLQIKADITGCEVVTLNVAEGGCLAGAMLAGVALGQWRSVDEATAALVHEERAYEPDAARHARYQELFARYRRIWPAIAEVAHEMTGGDGACNGSSS